MTTIPDSTERPATPTGGVRGSPARAGQAVPRAGTLPPAALGLARLIGEAIGERLWRDAMADVEAQQRHGESVGDGAR